MAECDAVDRAEEGQASLVKMEEELRDQDELKSKVKNILAELKAEDDRKLAIKAEKDRIEQERIDH